MRGASTGMRGALALAAMAVLPLTAAAQAVDISWNPARNFEAVHLPVFFRPGAPLEEPFLNAPRPALRLVDAFEDTSEDREHRLEQLAQCALLSEIREQSTLDILAGLPNGMIDWVYGSLRPGVGRDEEVSLQSASNRSLLPRLLSCSLDDAGAHPFDDLFLQLLTREQKYFSRFQDSSLSTFAVADGSQDLDRQALMEDQHKILFDACRKLYLGRFGTRLDERIRDEALDITRWHPVDFVVAPTMIAGYLYIRGWEKKLDLWGVRCTFQMEPLRQILDGLEGSRNDLVSAASLELGIGNFPLKAIVSFGIFEGDGVIDFVGIGTSLGKAKQVVKAEIDSLKAFE